MKLKAGIVLGAFGLALLAAPAASADASPENALLQLGGANGARVSSSPGVAMKTEHGVRIYRGAKAVAIELAGGEPAAAPVTVGKTVVVEHHYHSRIAHLRTQGFYSGHPKKSRRFTQGFYSGPVDKGRRHCAHE